MVEINYSIADGEIICHVDCPHKNDCANHESALDMRTETGPRPKLQKKDDKIHCSTFNKDFMKATFGAVTLRQME